MRAMEDFPAAHSMDTTWFAIDRDGHVAVFETGEAGCVPTDGYLGEDLPDPDLLRALPATGAKLDPEGQLVTSLGGAGHLTLDLERLPERVLAFVTDAAAVDDLVQRLHAKIRPATTGACLDFAPIDMDAFTALHTRGACTGCMVEYREESDDESFAAHGVYTFMHTCENWVAGPYARLTVPLQPLPASAVPAEILEHAVKYDGRFADTRELQPAEIWPCESWGGAWLASDHKTVRPFPDRLDEWPAEVESMREWGKDLVYVDDPGPAKAKPAPAPKKPWWKFW